LPSTRGTLGVLEWGKRIAAGVYPFPDALPERAAFSQKNVNVKLPDQRSKDESALLSPPRDGTCPRCAATCIVKLGARWHCNACALDFGPKPEVAVVTRADALGGGKMA